MQKVDDESHILIDVETDDIEAETKRGGTIRTCLVMEAPTDLRVCLVRPQTADCRARAKNWT